MPFFSHTVSDCYDYDAPLSSEPLRLDMFVSQKLRLLSRSQIKSRDLLAKINGKAAKLSRLVKAGDFIELSWNDPPPLKIAAQNIPLDIIYEDARVAVVNKAQGMVVHPGAGNRGNTLANALYFRRLEKTGGGQKPHFAKDEADALLPARAGIVHRLDKETSGVIIAAFDDAALAFLSRQFKEREVKKIYIAVIQGAPKEKRGRIETLVARDPKDRKKFAVSQRGKAAITFYNVLKTWQAHSLVALFPKTGRTHQLRLHMRHLGHPVLGDAVYGLKDRRFPAATLMLHAKSLSIVLPGETQRSVFEAPVPERFKSLLGKL